MSQPHSIILQAWTRVRDWDRYQWIDAVGLAGLFLFSFGVFYRTLLVHEGLLLMVVALALRIRTLEKSVLRDPLLILSAAFLLFLLIRTFYALTEFKEHQTLILEGTLKLFQFGFFIVFVVGFWMSRYRRRWNELVIVLFAGHLVRIFRKFDWNAFYNQFDQIWTGVERIGWGSVVNRFGLWSAVIFFGCIILYRNICGQRGQGNKIIHSLRVILWALATTLSGAGLVYSQSRSAWLAAAIVMPVVLFYRFYERKKLKLKPVLFIGILFVVISFMTNLPTVVEQRLFLSTNPFNNTNLNYAVDVRMSLYEIFWMNWKERPWFGYGPGTSEVIIKQSENKFADIEIMDHFHNFILDIMVQVGIVGALFYSLSFYYIIQQLLAAKKNGKIDRNYFMFVLISLTLMIICGLFGEPFADYKGLFLFGFLGAICYQYKFFNQFTSD